MPCRKVTTYWCRKCRARHLRGSSIGRKHYQYRIK